MTPERWKHVSDLAAEAWDREPSARAEFLDEACAGDPEARAAVEALLASDALAGPSFLAAPLVPGPVEYAPGSLLGPYRVVRELAHGGMGTVYAAERADGEYRKTVAIKVVRSAASADEVLRRFRHERQVLADLDHPNIAHLLDGGTTGDGLPYLVMEYVEGDTLAERIARGPLPLAEALALAGQIAEAMEAAHERGITHRDLKPANIKVNSDGVVKVLDFGLAKAARARAGAAGATGGGERVHTTQLGMILGTASYMSPEQARGQSIDKRTDIWAFGVILWEMLTGRQLFQADTPSDALAAVLTHQPDIDDVPPPARRLLSACLERDPRKRLRDIGDWRRLLDEAPRPAPEKRFNRTLLWAGAITITTAAVVLWAISQRDGATSDRPLVALDLDVGSEVWFPSVSRDGRQVAFVARGQLAVRRLDQPTATYLPGTEGASFPFFSPDGEWLAFFAGGRLRKIARGGGAPVILCAAADGRGGSWGEDGQIVAALSRTGGLSRVPAGGGPPEDLTHLPDGTPGITSHRFPQILPGHGGILFIAHTPNLIGNSLRRLPEGSSQASIVAENVLAGRYLTGSFLIYYQAGTLFARAMDVNRMEQTGPAIVLAEGVAFDSIRGAGFDLSDSGVLAYRNGAAGTDHIVARLEASGRGDSILADAGGYWTPRLSPDGSRLAVAIEPLVTNVTQTGLWIYDIPQQRMSRLTFEQGLHDYPVWRPDGEFLALRSAGALAITRADGRGKIQTLGASGNAIPWSFSADGRWLAFSRADGETGADLWVVGTESRSGELQAGIPSPMLRQPGNQYAPAISPDGRWLAYHSDESGRNEVYVTPFVPEGPPRTSKWQVSQSGGAWPIWARHERRLYYRNPERQVMAAAHFAKADAFAAEMPQVWSKGLLAETGDFPNFDVTADGRVIALFERKPETHLRVVLNVDDELRRRGSRR